MENTLDDLMSYLPFLGIVAFIWGMINFYQKRTFEKKDIQRKERLVVYTELQSLIDDLKSRVLKLLTSRNMLSENDIDKKIKLEIKRHGKKLEDLEKSTIDKSNISKIIEDWETISKLERRRNDEKAKHINSEIDEMKNSLEVYFEGINTIKGLNLMSSEKVLDLVLENQKESIPILRELESLGNKTEFTDTLNEMEELITLLQKIGELCDKLSNQMRREIRFYR